MKKESGNIDTARQIAVLKEEFPKARVVEIGSNQALERLAQFPEENILEYHYYFFKDNYLWLL